MIPFGLSPEQFRERYRRDLQRAAPGVIQRLRELLRQPLEEGLRDGEINCSSARTDATQRKRGCT